MVAGPSFLDANGSAIVAAKQTSDSGIGLEFSESFRITSGTVFREFQDSFIAGHC